MNCKYSFCVQALAIAQFGLQPRPCELPVPHDGFRRDCQNCGGFFHTQSAKESQLDNTGLASVVPGQEAIPDHQRELCRGLISERDSQLAAGATQMNIIRAGESPLEFGGQSEARLSGLLRPGSQICLGPSCQLGWYPGTLHSSIVPQGADGIDSRCAARWTKARCQRQYDQQGDSACQR